MNFRFAVGLVLCGLLGACGSDDAGGPEGGSGTGGAGGSGGRAGSGGAGAAGSGGDAGASGGDSGGAGEPSAGAGAGGDDGDAGAGGSDDPGPVEDVPEIPEVDETALPEPAAKAGFVEIEAGAYVAPLEPVTALERVKTRLFYSFIPADEGAKRKPTFVFFNGGPGSSSMMLFSIGTGPYSLDPDDFAALPQANPHSFSRLGNLLYIDARHTGFSYGVTAQPELEAERASAFTAGSFNAAVDGADFVRVVLRVLEAIPAIRNNPVVLVGESYGGSRAAVMLDLLLDPDPDYVAYVEASLSAELEAHFAAVFRGVDRERLTRAARARQFGWQVLIQPLVAGSAQFDAAGDLLPATLDRMAARLGISRDAIIDERCSFDVSRPDAWCDELDLAVQTTVTTPALFEQLSGVAPELVPGLRASERPGSFRFVSASGMGADPAPLVGLLGALSPWDRYFHPVIGQSVSGGFTRVVQTPFYVAPFLRAARNVETLITNSALDRVILSESIVPALNAVIPLFSEPYFVGAEYVDPDADPPTRIRLHYAAHEDLGPATERIIELPTYEESGHFVTAAEPDRLFEDVRLFLAESGLAE